MTFCHTPQGERQKVIFCCIPAIFRVTGFLTASDRQAIKRPVFFCPFEREPAEPFAENSLNLQKYREGMTAGMV